MTRNLVLAGSVILAVIFIIALVPSMLHPELYTKTPAEYSTVFHDDAGVYDKTDLNASESSLLLMQDLLDQTGPTTLNIRIKDPESAKEALLKYKGLLGKTNNLVIQIDMDETELKEYLNTHKDNQEILNELFNETSTLEALKQLEVQFTDQQNPDEFTSVVFKESAIRNRIKQLYNEYHQSEGVINSTASKFGLNTTEYQRSLEHFAEIVKAEEVNQVRVEEQAARLRESRVQTQIEPPKLTLFIDPSIGHYNDILIMTGSLLDDLAKVQNQTVRVTIENGEQRESKTDESGRYFLYYRVEKILPGKYTVISSSKGVVSNTGSITIVPTNSTTSLTANVITNTPDVKFSGQVRTGQMVPVRNAPVTIIWDRVNRLDAITDSEGIFHAEISVPNGDHTAQALFDGKGYPVSPSQSGMVTFTVAYIPPGVIPGTPPVLFILIMVTIIALSLGGALFYLKRKPVRQEKQQPVSVTVIRPVQEDQSPGETAMPVPEPDSPALLSLDFDQWIRESGAREASYRIYQVIVVLIQNDLHIVRGQCLTPREIASKCTGRHYSSRFMEFIGIYEWVRYGPGPVSDDEQNQLVTESRALINFLRGDGPD
jgi:hypothetical protein